MLRSCIGSYIASGILRQFPLSPEDFPIIQKPLAAARATRLPEDFPVIHELLQAACATLMQDLPPDLEQRIVLPLCRNAIQTATDEQLRLCLIHQKYTQQPTALHDNAVLCTLKREFIAEAIQFRNGFCSSMKTVKNAKTFEEFERLSTDLIDKVECYGISEKICIPGAEACLLTRLKNHLRQSQVRLRPVFADAFERLKNLPQDDPEHGRIIDSLADLIEKEGCHEDYRVSFDENFSEKEKIKEIDSCIKRLDNAEEITITSLLTTQAVEILSHVKPNETYFLTDQHRTLFKSIFANIKILLSTGTALNLETKTYLLNFLEFSERELEHHARRMNGDTDKVYQKRRPQI